MAGPEVGKQDRRGHCIPAVQRGTDPDLVGLVVEKEIHLIGNLSSLFSWLEAAWGRVGIRLEDTLRISTIY
jgi:hypothetical protein